MLPGSVEPNLFEEKELPSDDMKAIRFFRSILNRCLSRTVGLLKSPEVIFFVQRLHYMLFFLTNGVVKTQPVENCLSAIFKATENYPYTHQELFSLLSSDSDSRTACPDQKTLLRVLNFLAHPLRQKSGSVASLKRVADYYCWSKPPSNLQVTYEDISGRVVRADSEGLRSRVFYFFEDPDVACEENCDCECCSSR